MVDQALHLFALLTQASSSPAMGYKEVGAKDRGNLGPHLTRKNFHVDNSVSKERFIKNRSVLPQQLGVRAPRKPKTVVGMESFKGSLGAQNSNNPHRAGTKPVGRPRAITSILRWGEGEGMAV